MKKRYRLVPRPRKYDYQKDYPVKKAIYITLPVEIANGLDKLVNSEELSKIVERFIVDYVENNSKKD